MPPLPPDVVLTPEQVASFHERGFLSLPMITSPEEVAQLRDVLTGLFEQKAGWNEGAQFDLVSADDDTEGTTLTQIVQPVNYASELRNTRFRANAAAIARQLLGDEMTPSFEHSILKAADNGSPTPWHQDEAYRASDAFEYRQISIWMPLQDSDAENGCLRYIPGSHRRGVLRHRRVNDDPKVHSIECEPSEFDAATAVECPLPAGGAVIHSGHMIHSAGPNTTGASRLAYTLAFELPPRPATSPRRFYWNDDKQSADVLRRRAWRKRGGLAVEAVRRARYSDLHKPKRLIFEIRRVLNRPAK
jgi:ectoine hydroxylase-related dioxygenase (phytanoyl-CoA dioxygenase family)